MGSVYPLRLRFAQTPLPKGEARKAPRLALPLGELSPQVTERVLAVTVYPLRLRFAQTPLPKGEARGDAEKGNFGAYIYYQIRAGKVQKNRNGFSGRFKGVREEIRNPPDPQTANQQRVCGLERKK